MPQKLIASVDNVTNIKLGSKVQKLHGQPPQVLLTVSFAVPAGDITKVGALLNYELKESPVRIHFYTEEVQASLDGALAAKNAGLKECPECKGAGDAKKKDAQGVEVVRPCAVCLGTGKVPADSPSEQVGPGMVTPAILRADAEFAALGEGRDRLPAQKDASKPGAVPGEPKRRSRKKATLPGTGELPTVQTSDNGSHAVEDAKDSTGAGAVAGKTE